MPGQQSPQKGLDGAGRAQEGSASEFQARQESAQSGSGAGVKEESLKRRATCSGARLSALPCRGAGSPPSLLASPVPDGSPRPTWHCPGLSGPSTLGSAQGGHRELLTHPGKSPTLAGGVSGNGLSRGTARGSRGPLPLLPASHSGPLLGWPHPTVTIPVCKHSSQQGRHKRTGGHAAPRGCRERHGSYRPRQTAAWVLPQPSDLS